MTPSLAEAHSCHGGIYFGVQKIYYFRHPSFFAKAIYSGRLVFFNWEAFCALFSLLDAGMLGQKGVSQEEKKRKLQSVGGQRLARRYHRT